jgi:WD40 repeat protein
MGNPGSINPYDWETQKMTARPKSICLHCLALLLGMGMPLVALAPLMFFNAAALGQSIPQKPPSRSEKGYPMEVAFSADGKRIAVATSIGIWLYDAKTYLPVILLKGHTGRVRTVDFSPDGKLLASGSSQLLMPDAFDRSVRLWNVEKGQQIAALEEKADVECIRFSPNGNLLAWGDVLIGKTIKLWDVQHKKELAGIERRGNEHLWCLDFSPDGKTLAWGHRHTALWDLKDHKEITTLSGSGRSVRALSFSPDGKMLAAGSDNGTIALWHVESRKEIATVESSGNFSPSSLDFSPDGRTLAFGGRDRAVILWDVAARKESAKLSGHTMPVSSLAFSGDGAKLVTLGYDKTVRVWDVAKRKELAHWELAQKLLHSGRVLDHEDKPVENVRVDYDTSGRNFVHTDKNGRFLLPDGENPDRITVFAPPLDALTLWAPKLGWSEDVTIRLPQPATLKVVMDIPGAVHDNEHWYVLAPDKGWRLEPAGKDVCFYLHRFCLWPKEEGACRMRGITSVTTPSPIPPSWF